MLSNLDYGNRQMLIESEDTLMDNHIGFWDMNFESKQIPTIICNTAEMSMLFF